MEGLFFILLGIWFVNLMTKANNEANTQQAIVEKCPPHKWNWEDVKGLDGTVQSQRMVCLRCGPLKELLARE
jgi:hypothetical protein